MGAYIILPALQWVWCVVVPWHSASQNRIELLQRADRGHLISQTKRIHSVSYRKSEMSFNSFHQRYSAMCFCCCTAECTLQPGASVASANDCHLAATAVTLTVPASCVYATSKLFLLLTETAGRTSVPGFRLLWILVAPGHLPTFSFPSCCLFSALAVSMILMPTRTLMTTPNRQLNATGAMRRKNIWKATISKFAKIAAMRPALAANATLRAARATA